jgi:hypothetical protein
MNQGKQIDLLRKNMTPSLLDTKKGNELINAINALNSIEIIRKGTKDKIEYSENNVYLKLRAIPEEGGGGGNVDNFEEMDVLFCIDGEAKTKTILVKKEEAES